MKRILLLLSAILGCIRADAQQEPHYTQNQFNSNLLLNPAYAGSAPCASVGLRYRNQWAGFEGAPVTFSFIGEMKLAERLGAGLTLNQDRIGIDNAFTADLNIAYHLPIRETGKLAMGFKGGATFMTSDYNKLSGVTSPDPLYSGEDKFTIPYLGLGLLYYTPKSYVGFSIPRMVSFESTTTRTKISKPHYYLYGGHRFPFANGLELRPAMLARYRNEAPLEVDVAADLWYQNFVAFGLSWRTGDALGMMLKTRFKKLFLGYSYDMTVSRLRTMNRGTHEFFVGYEFCPKKQPETDPRTDNIRHF